MDRVGIYRYQAQLCRNLANREKNPQHKADLMELADRWDSLSSSLEQMIKTKGETFRPAPGNTSL